MTQPQPVDVGRIAWKIFLLQQANLFTSLPCAIYIVLLIAQIPEEQVGVAMLPIPVFALLCGVGLPLTLVWMLTRRAFAINPGEPPGARLIRLLKLPRALEVSILLVYIVGNSGYLYWLSWRLERPVYIVAWGSGVILVMMLLVMIWTRIFVERLLMPHAVEEFFKAPHMDLSGQRGFLWPKQRWYLPYCFALFVLCTVFALGSILVQMGMKLYTAVRGSFSAALMAILDQEISLFLSEAWLPLLLVSLFMIVTSAFAAYLLTQQQEKGFQAVQSSIEGLASGSPRMPSWVTTDETGDLAGVTARAFRRLREFSLSLDHSANHLGSNAVQLSQVTTKQNEALVRQAAALQEAQVTAQEIHQTSQTTSQRAESILLQSSRFEEIRGKGESAVRESLEGLQGIGQQVQDMAERIRLLSERTQQIDTVTRVVKDLADRCNMLALNAAIEAARSGESGRGFGVVAKEIRLMADQASKAANNVREMLVSLTDSIRDTVEITERGAESVNSNVAQLKTTGDNMRMLTNIIQDSVNSVRQISATVNQQSVGVQQIFQAINDLNAIMGETLKQVNEVSGVTSGVERVATEVQALISDHGWRKMEALRE
jgi:methyl-accepting chemotaxis protein